MIMGIKLSTLSQCREFVRLARSYCEPRGEIDVEQISDQAIVKNIRMMGAKIASWALVVLFSILTGCLGVDVAQLESSTPQTVVVINAMRAQGPRNVERAQILAEAECVKHGRHVIFARPCSKFICYKSRVYYECGDYCGSNCVCHHTPTHPGQPVNTATEGPNP